MSKKIVQRNEEVIKVELQELIRNSDETGRQTAKSLRFSNTTDGAEKLLDYIHGCNQAKETTVIGMEATGHYWLSLYCFLFDQGFQVNVINPIQSDAVRKLFLRKTKNDAKDSFLIAETIRIGRFSNTELADEDILALRQLCRHRMDLVDYIADQKRKIIGVMDRVFPEYQNLFSDMFGRPSTNFLLRPLRRKRFLPSKRTSYAPFSKKQAVVVSERLKLKRYELPRKTHLASLSPRLLLPYNSASFLK